MQSIAKLNSIKPEALDKKHYLSSFLREAYRQGLLNDVELEGIQMQILHLLARQTERYTGGESSSVRVETAQGLLLSIFYSIGLYLKSLPDTDTVIEVLK